MTSNENIISIKQVLAWMDSGKPFSCTVVAYDRKRKKGGHLIEYPEAELVKPEEKPAAAVRPLTRQEEQRRQLAAGDDGRNPNHRHWYTRNIRELLHGQPTAIIRKIHPPLLLIFNSKTVVP